MGDTGEGGAPKWLVLTGGLGNGWSGPGQEPEDTESDEGEDLAEIRQQLAAMQEQLAKMGGKKK